MLRWLSDGPLVRATSAALGVANWREVVDAPGAGSQNASAQVLLTGIMSAAWAQLAAELPAPVAIAGYSVGELAAFAAAGVFEPADALALARERAAAMDRCAALEPGGLLAVSGVPMAQIDTCLRQCTPPGALSVAIRNAPWSVVLGGPASTLSEATTQLSARGARCSRLHVAVASHTPSMRQASLEFANALATRSLHAPRIPLFSSTADRISSGPDAASALADQISTTLRWDDCLESVHARQVDCVLEIGPGAALASMWNQRFPPTPARSADEFQDRQAVVGWVRKQCERA